MCNKKLSLFDALLQELNHDLEIYNPTFQSKALVSYSDTRTQRQTDACTSGRLYAIRQLIPGLHKRFIGDTASSITSNDERHHNAVIEFLTDNQRCVEFNDSDFPANCNDFIRTVIGEASVLLKDSLDSSNGSCLNLSSISRGLRVGPGSSSGVPGDAGTYGRLCDGRMTFSSPDVAGVYKACMLATRLSATAEAVRYSLYGVLDSFDTKAIFLSVPKTNKKNRGICTQPSGNMVLQLATHEILSEQLRLHFGCDLSNQQDKNRFLARLGSLGQKSWSKSSWEFCTVDLKSASNFPWLLVKTFFPDIWVKWLALIRSPSIEIDGEVCVKAMCSSMGNGFTFSLMTILLSSIVKTLYRLADLPEYDFHHSQDGAIKTWAVYGDDIIVDKKVVNALYQVLAACGFLVNKDKSFDSGLFKESCGADFYDGYPVRPVFLETLETTTDIYSLLNRLVLWGVTHSVDLPRTLSFLRSQLGKDVLRVPNWEDFSAGLHVPFSMCNHKPTDIPMNIRRLLNVGNVAYRCNIARAKKRTLFSEINSRTKRYYSDIQSRCTLSFDFVSKVKVNAKNLPGMLLCMLEGSVRNGRYGIRQQGDVVRYEEVWRIAPSWGDPSLFFSDAAVRSTRPIVTLGVYRLWEEYVKRNVSSRRR